MRIDPYRFLVASLSALLILALQGAAAHAQTIAGRDGEITLGGRVHSQFATSSVSDEGSDFFIRRARLTVGVVLGDRLDGRVMTEFAGGSAALQDAYVRYRLTPQLRVSVGQFKRAFDLFELESSTRLPVVERDGRIPGFSGCTGVAGTCSYSRMTEKLSYAGRDVGIRFDGSLSERADYVVTVTNGTGINRSDENGGKSVSGRLTVTVAPNVTVGANAGIHDWLFDPGAPSPESTEYAVAGGADVKYGDYGGGPLLMAGVVFGDNWQAADGAGTPAGFAAVQVIGSYYHELAGVESLHGIEPVVRLSFGDPSRDLDDDGGLLITPGAHIYFSGRNRLGVNLDVFSPQSGDTEFSLKSMWYIYF